MFSYPKTSTSKVALAFVSVLALGPFGLLVPAVFASSPKLNSISPSRGQRISAEIEAMRLGRAAFDPYLVIHDGAGAVLAAADDTALLMQDSFLSLIAPKDGTYIIQVRETSYGGSGDFQYRLHVGTFPRPTAVYPAGGPAGETLSVKFLGDPAGEFSQAIKLPAQPREKFG